METAPARKPPGTISVCRHTPRGSRSSPLGLMAASPGLPGTSSTDWGQILPTAKLSPGHRP